MDQLWLSAPGLAIRLRPQGSGMPAWQLNPPASAWSSARQLGSEHWDAWVARLLCQLGAHRELMSCRAGVGLPPIELAWTAVALDDGWLVWLAPEAAEVERLRRRLDRVQRLGQIGVWELDLKTGQGRWDEHMHRLLGAEPADNSPFFDELVKRVHPDDLAQLQHDHQRVAETLGQHEMRFRLAMASGEFCDVLCMLDVEGNADGRPERMTGLLVDDTPGAALLRATKASAAKWLRAIDLASVSVWRINLPSGQAEHNDQGFRMLGREPDLNGQTLAQVRETIHPDDRAAVERAAEEAMATGRVVDVEARYRKPSGDYIHLLTRRVAERDEQGRVTALSGVSLDITDRVSEREKAEAFARRVNMVTNAAGVAIWSVDVETNVTEWNDQMFQLYGLPPEGGPLVPKVWLNEFIHPEDREEVRAHRIVVTTGTQGVHGEFRIVRRDGTVRWVSAWSRREVLAGRVMVFGVNIDITDLQSAKVELRHAQERARLAAESAGIGTWERNLRTGKSRWDSQMYRLRGLPPGPEEPPDSSRYAAYHPDDLAMINRYKAIAGRHGDGYENEFRVVFPDGTIRWLAARGVMKRAEDGTPERMLGVTWDITERHLAEQALRDKVAAEQSSQAKSQFLARMSHELRTPLNAVLGFAQLLSHDATDPLSEQQRMRVERIHSAGLHLLALIDDVLDLATIESDALPLTNDSVSLQQAIDDVLQWTQPQASQAKVTVHAEATDGWVSADPRRVRQVLSNLLSNAIKYNRLGGQVRITTRACQHEAQEAWQVCVSDSGRGLTAEQAGQLFQPFNRLGAERGGIQGTGIGLAIVRHLVRLMGGEVSVSSEPGRGSEFRVTLPAAAPRDASDYVPLSGYQDDLGAGELTSRLSLLYVEDNPVNALLVQELVAMRSDLMLELAVDGESGVTQACARPPDVMLIDMQLPDMDGFEVLRRVRAEPALSHTTMVALSANAMPEDVSRARAAGFDDYWTKPIDFHAFLRALGVLAEHHAARARA